MEPSSHWSVLQLAEFVAAVASTSDESALVSAAVERAAEAVDAEVAALFHDDRIVVSVGFGGSPPVAAVGAVASGRANTLDVPGCGPCPALAVPLETAGAGTLVFSRSDAAFSGEEQALLRAMARVLALVVQLLRVHRSEATARADASRLLADLDERRALLEHLLDLQHSIAQGVPASEIFEAVAAGARALLGGRDAVGVRLVCADDPSTAELVSLAGASWDDFLRRRPVDVGVSGRAIIDRALVVAEEYAAAPAGDPDLAAVGLRSAMAAPVFQNGQVAGSLVVSTRDPDRRYTTHEQDVLRLFAEHVSLALNDEAARQAMARALEDAVHRATHDELTGLPNRVLVLDRLAQALARTERSSTPATVLFVDLDRFKVVNDVLGHRSGDLVLTEVAARLRAAVRPEDTVGRLSGDEFVVLCEGLDLPGCEEVAERIAQAVARPIDVAGRDTRLTASVGIARGEAGQRAEDLLGDADVALYRAKELGRARVEHFDRGLRERMQRRLHTEQALRSALPGGLVLHYQPTVGCPEGEVVGMEALLRWQHPERGLLPPDEFIDVAEETGLVLPMGRWVIAQACADAARWQVEVTGMREVSLAVNLSARQLADPGLLDAIDAALERSGLAPEDLWIELTESTLLEDTETSSVTLDALRARGVRLAIDDFGTGYSSLAYLRRFHVDVVKIDRSFVAHLTRSAEDEVIVRAVLRLAEELGFAAVAEGVETLAQHRALVRLGCRMGQGFLYGRPAPFGALAAGPTGGHRAWVPVDADG